MHAGAGCTQHHVPVHLVTLLTCSPLYSKMFIGGLNWETTDGKGCERAAH